MGILSQTIIRILNIESQIIVFYGFLYRDPTFP